MQCEMCLKKTATIRTGEYMFLGAVCDDCFDAVVNQEEPELSYAEIDVSGAWGHDGSSPGLPPRFEPGVGWR